MTRGKKKNGRIILQICNPPDPSGTDSITIALGVLTSFSVENIQLDVLVNSRMGLRLAGPDSTGAVVHVVGNEFEMLPDNDSQDDSDDDEEHHAIEISADLADVARMFDQGEVREVVFERDLHGGDLMFEGGDDVELGQGGDVSRGQKWGVGAETERKEEKNNGKLVVKKTAGSGLPVITHRSGVKFQDIIIGSGKKVQRGHRVAVQYVLRLENGKVVDRADRKRPFKFRLGIGEVVKGFDIGLTGMREGGERHVVVPPQLGYGDASVPGIPKGSTLYFDITVLKAF